KKIRKHDFTVAMNTLKLEVKQQQNIFRKMEKAMTKWIELIDIGFLNEEFREQYKAIINERANRVL
ncbi:MAG: hypothetical protein RQ761_13195, partial [Bacteroidales bacterium]|nr:hypothetical protein [Bacteroidales bacterium]